MKNIFIAGFVLAMLSMFVACDPNEFDKDELTSSTAPSSEEIEFTISEGDDDFHFDLVNLTEVDGVYTAKWSLGNGSTATGDEVEAYYALPDTYTVTLTISAADGSSASASKTITQTETDYSIFTSDNFIYLSGGIDDIDGKVWVMDSLVSGHIGVGPSLDDPDSYWSASALVKTGVGMYDDEITFTLDGFGFDYENNGYSYVKESEISNSYYSDATQISDDYRVSYTDPASGTWFIDGDYLTIYSSGNPLYPIFDVGAVDGLYKILYLDENNMELSCIGADGNGWGFKLISKGYVAEVVEKSLESNDIFEDFEGNGNIDWTADVTGFETISNFAKVGVNTSDYVAMYSKGTGSWESIYTELEYRMDLSVRNVFTMKVFIPNFNDYETQCQPSDVSWLSEYNLKPQVEVKLQDATLGSSAWETQATVINTISEADYGTWVDLIFDFSAYSDRTDFDQIVVQLGAEGHCNEGIFYIDDFILSE
ncbi:PKD domain-containing protein [Labilibaculum sp.]|uniref:PKD domain-containing protein n=1 Tax=Labilibaculum sp. TaxID=2060723 RepID=UPI003566C9D1